jgi:hypothetical protein
MLDKLLAQGAAVRKGASSSTSTTVGRSRISDMRVIPLDRQADSAGEPKAFTDRPLTLDRASRCTARAQ